MELQSHKNSWGTWPTQTQLLRHRISNKTHTETMEEEPPHHGGTFLSSQTIAPLPTNQSPPHHRPPCMLCVPRMPYHIHGCCHCSARYSIVDRWFHYLEILRLVIKFCTVTKNKTQRLADTLYLKTKGNKCSKLIIQDCFHQVATSFIFLE